MGFGDKAEGAQVAQAYSSKDDVAQLTTGRLDHRSVPKSTNTSTCKNLEDSKNSLRRKEIFFAQFDIEVSFKLHCYFKEKVCMVFES